MSIKFPTRSKILFSLAPRLLPDERILSWLCRCAESHDITLNSAFDVVCDHIGYAKPSADVDWDIDPDPIILRGFELGANLEEGTLLRQRMRDSPLNLHLYNRTSYCPFCAERDIRCGNLPAFRRLWVLSTVTHCPVHEYPLVEWPWHRARDIELTFDPWITHQATVAATGRRFKFTRETKKKSGSYGLDPFSRDLSWARGEGHRLSNCENLVTAEWRYQMTMEREWSNLIVNGAELSGELSVLGAAVDAQYALQDAVELLICRLAHDDLFPIIRFIRLPRQTHNLCIFRRWTSRDVPPLWNICGGGCEPLSKVSAPGLRRTALAVANSCLIEVVRFGRRKPPKGEGLYSQCFFHVLSELPPSVRKFYNQRRKAWPVQLQEATNHVFARTTKSQRSLLKADARIPSSDGVVML